MHLRFQQPPMAARAALLCSATLVVWCTSSVAFAASWGASVNEWDGLPSLSLGGTEALSNTFAYWTKNQSWAEQETEFKILLLHCGQEFFARLLSCGPD